MTAKDNEGQSNQGSYVFKVRVLETGVLEVLELLKA